MGARGRSLKTPNGCGLMVLSAKSYISLMKYVCPWWTKSITCFWIDSLHRYAWERMGEGEGERWGEWKRTWFRLSTGERSVVLLHTCINKNQKTFIQWTLVMHRVCTLWSHFILKETQTEQNKKPERSSHWYYRSGKWVPGRSEGYSFTCQGRTGPFLPNAFPLSHVPNGVFRFLQRLEYVAVKPSVNHLRSPGAKEA